MESPLDLVERFDEITPKWLTNALRKGGVVKNAVVESVDIVEQGLSAGFVSGLARITPTYSEGGEGAPASIIAKLPSLDPATEALSTSFHMYEREPVLSRDWTRCRNSNAHLLLQCHGRGSNPARTTAG
jgi:hypothetical protein